MNRIDFCTVSSSEVIRRGDKIKNAELLTNDDDAGEVISSHHHSNIASQYHRIDFQISQQFLMIFEIYQ